MAAGQLMRSPAAPVACLVIAWSCEKPSPLAHVWGQPLLLGQKLVTWDVPVPTPSILIQTGAPASWPSWLAPGLEGARKDYGQAGSGPKDAVSCL